MDGGMEGWMDGWREGWRDGWMDGWRDGKRGVHLLNGLCINPFSCSLPFYTRWRRK